MCYTKQTGNLVNLNKMITIPRGDYFTLVVEEMNSLV